MVISGDDTNADSSWPVFAACPISSQDYSTEFDVKIAAGAGGLSKKGWIRVPLLQPFAKTDVLDRAGQFEANVIEEVVARWLKYANVI